MASLIDELKAIQKREGWADGQMADKLGVSRTLWLAVRNGTYPIARSMTLLQGAVRAFPTLGGQALVFLQENATAVKAESDGEDKGSEVA